MKILVTGGAGFVGSHLIDSLLAEGHDVTCLDDLSLGKEGNISHNLKNQLFRFIRLDLLDKKSLGKIFKTHRFECVFHLAANSDIGLGAKYPSIDQEKTFLTTFNILEAMRLNGVKKIIFTSSSAIYGELNNKIQEDSGPLMPVSLYGAGKLASEGFISAYTENYGFQAWIIRFPNVVGERATHGVVYDFIMKLRKNPKELVILGDGTQKKPYCYVRDIVDGILFVWKNTGERINYYNIGVDSSTTVKRIAEIVIEEMKLKNVRLSYTGGKKGWVGDVPVYSYDLSKITTLGWRAKFSSDEAVRTSVRLILDSKFI